MKVALRTRWITRFNYCFTTNSRQLHQKNLLPQITLNMSQFTKQHSRKLSTLKNKPETKK
jgi:hypothetical protein